jgi:hypothetical protein
LIFKFELQVTITTAVNLSSLLPVVNKSTVFSRSSTGEAILPAGALKSPYKPWTTFHFFVDKKIIGYILSLLKDDCQMNIYILAMVIYKNADKTNRIVKNGQLLLSGG